MNDTVKILIADDNKCIANAMMEYVKEDIRYEIVGISSDELTEIKMIEEFKPNVVITDIKKKMGWTGIEIIEHYQDSNDKPIFVLVSESITDYYSKIRELNIEYCLLKPFIKEDFLEILNRVYYKIYPNEILIKENKIVTANSMTKLKYFFEAIKNKIM